MSRKAASIMAAVALMAFVAGSAFGGVVFADDYAYENPTIQVPATQPNVIELLRIRDTVCLPAESSFRTQAQTVFRGNSTVEIWVEACIERDQKIPFVEAVNQFRIQLTQIPLYNQSPDKLRSSVLDATFKNDLSNKSRGLSVQITGLNNETNSYATK